MKLENKDRSNLDKIRKFFRIFHRIFADFYVYVKTRLRRRDTPCRESTVRVTTQTDGQTLRILPACEPARLIRAWLLACGRFTADSYHCLLLLPPCVDAAAAAAVAADSYKNNDVTDQSPVHDELELERHVRA